VKIYTKKGDDGSTGLLFGGRVDKDAIQIELNGAVDETQAALGLARAFSASSELSQLCIYLERDLWVLMAEVATSSENRSKLVAKKTMVDASMVAKLEEEIDRISALFDMPREFVIPGGSPSSAFLDWARVTARRAERISLPYVRQNKDTEVGRYLNRLSDLLWTMARWQDGQILRTRDIEEGV
jgi:cob(I)alamin adenosyltransferase